ncbi:MAG: carotenoid oxygenase family protein [Bryobacterales bacterium]|nr:carotenoid oxygenase family protein [Bryobacterales bacterium]
MSHDAAPYLERCFLFDATEDSYPITEISGTIPASLRGTYYVNGPARFERAGQRYKHWLDGDGMVCAMRFDDAGAHFTNRFVRTGKLREEEESGRFVYRGFGTAFNGDRLRRNVMLEPPVNVSVYPFGGTLLAFAEQSLPFELDPVTLETRGEYDFQGRLNSVTPFAAHAKFDPASGNMVNFGISYAADKPALHLYEFEPGGSMLRRRRFAIGAPHSNHDFGLTPSFAVFYLSPLLMDFQKFWGGVSVMESLRWEPESGSRILVAPRTPGADSFTIEAGQGYCLHVINCFEDGGRLIVDILELEAPVYPEYQPVPDLFANVTPCRPTRYVIDLANQRLSERIAMTYDRAPDFPSVDPALVGFAYDEFWMLGISACGQPGRKFFDQLAHGDWRTGSVDDIYQTEPGVYLGGEPVYVNGSILVEHLDAREKKCEMWVFDASHVAKGPVTRLPLRHPVHPGFHASFAPSAAA